MRWNDFNNAEDQSGFEVIPKGTLAKVRMTIKPGGHDDASQGWTDGWATRSPTTGSVYLNCEWHVERQWEKLGGPGGDAIVDARFQPQAQFCRAPLRFD